MRARWVFLMPLLVACPGTDDKDDTDTADTGDTDTDTDTDSDTDSDTDTDTDPTASLSGQVTGPTGSPMEGFRVNMCRQTCITQTTDASGNYTFPTVPAATQSFEVVPVGDDWSQLAYAFVPITLAEDEQRVLDAHMLTLPAFQSMPTSSTEVEFAPGLFITLSADEVTLGFGVDADTLAAVAVPEVDRLPVELPGTVVAMWYLSPFETEPVDGGLSYRIENTWGGTDGENYEVWAGSYGHYSWEDAGTPTLTDGFLTGDSLPVLSTIVVIQPD